MISDLREMLDQLEQLDMSIGDLLVSDASVAFKPLRENLQYLRSELRKYTLQQKRLLQQILPRVRSGDTAEEELADLYQDYVSSVFWFDSCESFIAAREREVNAILKLMKMFEVQSNMEMADFERANDVQYIFQRDKVVVLDLNILTPKSLIDNFLTNKPTDESDFWFNNKTMTAGVGNIVRQLLQFGQKNVDLDDRGYIFKITG